MKRRIKRLNKLIDNYRPIVPREGGGVGADCRRVTEENIARRARYMCKTPRKAYRIDVKTGTDPEGNTEVFFKTYKSLLEPGQHVTLFHLLKHLDLQDLLIGGGEGVEIRRRALRQLVRTSGASSR